MDALCNSCTKRQTCELLCKAAEKYVNQDHVERREILISDLKRNPATGEYDNAK